MSAAAAVNATQHQLGSGDPAPVEHRTCRVCAVTKAITEFHRRDHDRRRSDCRTCVSERNKARYRENPERKRAALRRSVYRLGPGQFEAMLARQDGRCAVCGDRPTATLAVDHDHATGEVRGLLCRNCNQGLGHFRDDPQRLARAIDYLEWHRVVMGES